MLPVIGQEKIPGVFRGFFVKRFRAGLVLELGGEELAVQAGPAPPFSKGGREGL